MATTTAIKFYKNAYANITAAKTAATGGAIVFDTASQTIFVDGKQYGGLVDATFANNVLTITKANSATPVSLDFSTLASAESVMHAFQELHTEVDAIETGAGLGENGAYTANTNTNYISDATSLKDADEKLDAQLKSVSDTVSGLTSGTVSDVKINDTSVKTDGVANIAVEGTYDASDNKIATESTVEDAITALTGSATIASNSDGVVTLKAGITETNGVVSNNSGSDITLAKVATTADAEDITVDSANYGGSTATTNLQTALTNLAGKVDSGVVSTFGGQTGDITLESHLSLSNKQLTTDATGTGILATTGDITTAIEGLDVDNITGMGAGKTILTLTETDGKVAATFQDISITASQISDGATTFEAKFTDGTHDVATMGSHTPGTGETATYKLELYSATQTNGALGTADSPDATVYFKSTPTAANPVVTSSDLSGIVGAMVYQGVVDGTNALPASPEKGWVYMVAADGTYAGKACETGDMIVYNGSSWDVINGENQVTNGGATIVAGAGTASTIATVDGTAITAQVSVTGGSATIASVADGVVTLKVGVTQTGTTGTIGNATGGDITLAKVATTGTAADVAIADSGENFTATNVEGALAELKGAITSSNITIDGHKGAITTGNGLNAVSADGGSFSVKIDQNNTNGLSVGTDGIALALATTTTAGAMSAADKTKLNGIVVDTSAKSVTDGTNTLSNLVSDANYTHITVTSTSVSDGTNTLEKYVHPTATPAGAAAVKVGNDSNGHVVLGGALTGSDITATSGNYGGSTATTNVQGALDNLTTAIANKTAAVVDGSEVIVVNDSTATTIATVDGAPVSTKVAFYWEEYN